MSGLRGSPATGDTSATSSRIASALTALALGSALFSGCAASPSPPPVFSVASPTPNPTSSAANRLHIVTIGDSLMSGYGLDRGQSWPTLLANTVHVTVTNLACGGMGFVVSGDCGAPYSGLIPALAALQPDIVIVQSSSNDFGETPDDIHSDTLATVEEMHDAAPQALIVGLSTVWSDDMNLPDEVSSTSDELHDAIDAVGGRYIDVGQPLAGHPEWMQGDDVHPTAQGQQAIEHDVIAKLTAAGII